MGKNNRIFKSVKKLMTNQRHVPNRISAGINSRQTQHKAHQCLGGGTI
jgi:hypothetical protein